MKKKKISSRELSRISQKWHCNEHLTPEEDELLPQVVEWENSHTEFEREDDSEDVSLEEMYFAIYGIRL